MSAYKSDLGSASFAAIGPGAFTRHFLLRILKEDARGVVATITGSDAAKQFIQQINETGQYQVDVRGEFQGKRINEIQTGHAFAAGSDVSKKSNAAEDKEAFLALVREGKIKHLFTNTDDPTYGKTDIVPFLAEILHEAYKHDQEPPIIIPFELNPDGNGAALRLKLREEVAKKKYANNVGGPSFVSYCDQHLKVLNTLVDSQADHDPQDKSKTRGEPFILLAIEKMEGLEMSNLPFKKHPNIRLTEHFQDYNRIKFGLLNVIHTAMTQHWIARGKKVNGEVMPKATTRDFLSDPEYRQWTVALLTEIKAVVEKSMTSDEGRTYLKEFFQELLPRLESKEFAKKHEKISTGHSGKLDDRLGWLKKLAITLGLKEETPLLDAVLENAVSRDQLNQARAAFKEALGDDALFEQVRAILNKYIPEEQKEPHEQVVTKGQFAAKFSAAMRKMKAVPAEKMQQVMRALGAAYKDIVVAGLGERAP